jgi:predicted 3-demethylubiquinone-9 3-methyltransferase (glyoxalase superfamily)
MDSDGPHQFTFTPATSLFVDLEDAAAFDRVYGGLAPGGTVLMAPGDYGFSPRFTWLNDRFGVSWQLNQTA